VIATGDDSLNPHHFVGRSSEKSFTQIGAIPFGTQWEGYELHFLSAILRGIGAECAPQIGEPSPPRFSGLKTPDCSR